MRRARVVEGNLCRYHFWPRKNFDVKLCELSLFFRTDGRTDRHFIMSRRAAVADRLGHEACGMWHAALTNWNAAVSVEKVNEANRKPQTTDQSAVLRTAEGPANPASLAKKKYIYIPNKKRKKTSDRFLPFLLLPSSSSLHFLLHPQFWMMANFVFDFCALRDAVCSWQIFSLSDFWQRLLWPTGRLCHLGASQQCIKCAPGWVCVCVCLV